MSMNVNEMLEGLDRLFEQQRMDEVEPYLQQALKEAMETNDASCVITIVNELIGFYRDTSQYEKAIYYCEQILPFMENQGLKGTIHYATTCLNVANAYRAAGRWQDSLFYYEKVKETYDEFLPENDSLYASYYNNLSLLYQEMGQFEEACVCLKKALAIMEQYQDEIKIAITCSNLAASLLRTGNQQQAEGYLNRALTIFVEDGERDFHYGAALSVMGELQFQKGNLQESKKYYQKALAELDKHVGKTEYYYRTLDNLEQVEKAMEKEKITSNGEKASLGLGLAREFYEEYGKPMIQKKFPAFEDKIAVGKVGEGSECFGFDDNVSIDHDFGPGFSLWVTKDTYEQIGEYLQAEYEKLPTTYRGITRKTMEQGKGRVGVCVIDDFYERIIGRKNAPVTIEEWAVLDEAMLATATNGEIYKDEEGIFTGIRNQLLSYYPDEIWLAKIAQEMYHISQYGQYNYGRMLSRKDLVSAGICRSHFAESVMKLVYLLNRSYAPYYKWMYKGLEAIDSFGLKEKLEALSFIPVMNQEDNEELIENICIYLLKQLEKMGLIKQRLESTYLEHYIGQIMNLHGMDGRKESLKGKERQINKDDMQNSTMENEQMKKEDGNSKMVDKEELVKELVQLEWKCFDQVQNEGGRADCQDDWNTFSIMRTSQYLTWTEEMLQSYILDFKNAIAKGWNLITEKYGRMMESTAPMRYREIKDQFPPLSEEKKAIIEAIVQIQVTWMEEFAKEYPYMAGNSRVIHTSEDTPYSTSFETYLRGEMGTYSDRTLDLYGRFIVSYLQEGKNLTKDIMTNTALLYGYESLEKAEQLLSGNR